MAKKTKRFYKKSKKDKKTKKNNIKKKIQQGGVFSDEVKEHISKITTDLTLQWNKLVKECRKEKSLLEIENNKLQDIISNYSAIMKKPHIFLDPPFPNPPQRFGPFQNPLPRNNELQVLAQGNPPKSPVEFLMKPPGRTPEYWQRDGILYAGWSTLSNAAIGRKYPFQLRQQSQEHKILHAVSPTQLIKICLARGADPNFINYDGTTPTQLAALYGTLESVKILVEAGGKLNKDSLHKPQITEWPPKLGTFPMVDMRTNINLVKLKKTVPNITEQQAQTGYYVIPGKGQSYTPPFTFEEHKEKVAWIEEQLAKEDNP